MNMEMLPWQIAFRVALILLSNISIAFIIQLTALERRRSLLALTLVYLGRNILLNLLGGIVFQDYIAQNPFWNNCYEFFITFQSVILWGVAFYTFAGDALKIMVVSIAAEIYTVALNGVILAMINFVEGRNSLFLSAGPFQPLDLFIPLVMYAVFLPLYFFFRDRLRKYRNKELKHRKFWISFTVLYILLGIMSWWNGYANKMSQMSWVTWLLFFLMAAGAGTVGVISWMGYMKRIEMEHRALKKQQEFLGLHRKAIDEQIQRMEENQKIIDHQMKEIEKFEEKAFSGERAENYLKKLKQEYHSIKAGVYCSEWEIDAVLYYYARKASQNQIFCSFFFGNYRKGSLNYEVLSEILVLLLEESIERNLTVEAEKRKISLTAGTVKNQVVLILETRCKGRFQIGKLRYFLKKHQGIVKSEKNEGGFYVKVMIPCTEYYNQKTVSE